MSGHSKFANIRAKKEKNDAASVAPVRIDPVKIRDQTAPAAGTAGMEREDLAERFAAALGMEAEEVEVIGLG